MFINKPTRDKKPFPIKEFELHQLKKETNGFLNGIINCHISALKKKRIQQNQGDKTNLTRMHFRAYSPLKNQRHLHMVRKAKFGIYCSKFIG